MLIVVLFIFVICALVYTPLTEFFIQLLQTLRPETRFLPHTIHKTHCEILQALHIPLGLFTTAELHTRHFMYLSQYRRR